MKTFIFILTSLCFTTSLQAQNSPRDRALLEAKQLKDSKILYADKDTDFNLMNGVPEKIRGLEKRLFYWRDHQEEAKAEKALGIFWKEIEKKPIEKKKYFSYFSKLVQNDYLQKLKTFKTSNFAFLFLKPLSTKQTFPIRVVDTHVDAVALLFFDSSFSKIQEIELDGNLLSHFYGQSFRRIIKKSSSPQEGLKVLLSAMEKRVSQLETLL